MLATGCALAACGGETTQPNPPGGGSGLTGLWDASISGIKAIDLSGQTADCTASWVMSIDTLAFSVIDPLGTQLPYTATIRCEPGETGIWPQRGRQFIVRQSGDSFAFLSAERGDTFMVGHLASATELSGRMAEPIYVGAVFSATRHAGSDPNRSPFALDLFPQYLNAEVGDSAVMAVRVHDAYYAEIPDAPVRWSSSAPGVATVGSDGVVHGVATGDALITARIDTLVRFVAFTVLQPPASIAIVSAPDSLIDPDTTYIQAVARSANGQILFGRRFHWSTSDAAVATVGDGGDAGYLLTTGPGTVTITARSTTTSASVSIPVLAGVARIDVGGVPPGGAITIGNTAQLTATPRDAQGNALSGRPVMWFADALLGSIELSPAGLVTAHRGGPGTVVVQVGDSTRRVNLVAQMDGRFTALAAGGSHTCGLTITGRIYCWGSEANGRIGPVLEGGPGGLPLPSPETFVAVEAGLEHSCALNAAGGAFCWGADDWGRLGQLGGGVGEVQTVPGGHAFTQLTAGGGITCGVTAAHAAYCWGFNQFGELGRGTTNVAANATPALVVGSHAFTEVRAGWSGACGLTTSGEAWCWGGNQAGELGLGTFDNLAHPTPVHATPGLTFSALAVGGARVCGLTAGGHVTCWGNSFGPPAEVPGVSGIVRITGGNLGFCGVNGANIMSCWGLLEPHIEYTPSAPIADFTVGATHTCAVPVTGKAVCWGYAGYQLGGEEPSTVNGPVEIIGQP
jgi:alpha-tubulin suppressor-like RCC1 family protein